MSKNAVYPEERDKDPLIQIGNLINQAGRFEQRIIDLGSKIHRLETRLAFLEAKPPGLPYPVPQPHPMQPPWWTPPPPPLPWWTPPVYNTRGSTQ